MSPMKIHFSVDDMSVLLQGWVNSLPFSSVTFGSSRPWTCCFTSTEARLLIRDGDGVGGERTKEWRLDRGYCPQKTGETLDRHKNNGSVKAVSPCHCSATSALRSCCFNCRAGQSHKDNVCCTAVEKQPGAKEVQLSQPSSTSLFMISSGPRVQLHLPAHDLFWANLKVQLHLPPFSSCLEPCVMVHLTRGMSFIKKIHLFPFFPLFFSLANS